MSEEFTSIEHVMDNILSKLEPQPSNVNNTKVATLFAGNSSGKTRLSQLFFNRLDEHVLCYNAYMEDLYSWDNRSFSLKIEADEWIFQTIQENLLIDQISNNFRVFTGSEIEPIFDFPAKRITFRKISGVDEDSPEIKISRGEERVFIWTVFFTVLKFAIVSITQASGSETSDFGNLQYVVIDDPVSSMDDANIIAIALALADLISKSEDKLKFLITTHHALFFNVLYKKAKNRRYYVLSKSDSDESEEKFHLKEQKVETPFAYHHVIISVIDEAIRNSNLKKYHFNLFRALLEKTANYLGYYKEPGNWKKLLPQDEIGLEFIKAVDHYSHDRFSEIESSFLTESDVENFKIAFRYFINEYKWDITLMFDSSADETANN